MYLLYIYIVCLLCSWITSFNILASGALDVINFIINSGEFEHDDVSSLSLTEFLQTDNHKDSLFVNLLNSGHYYEFQTPFWFEFGRKYRIHHRPGEIDAQEDDDDSMMSNSDILDSAELNDHLTLARRDVQALLRKNAKQRMKSRLKGLRKLEWNRGGTSFGLSGKTLGPIASTKEGEVSGRSSSRSQNSGRLGSTPRSSSSAVRIQAKGVFSRRDRQIVGSSQEQSAEQTTNTQISSNKIDDIMQFEPVTYDLLPERSPRRSFKSPANFDDEWDLPNIQDIGYNSSTTNDDPVDHVAPKDVEFAEFASDTHDFGTNVSTKKLE